MSIKLPKGMIKQLDKLMNQLMTGNANTRAVAMNHLIGFEQSGRIPLPLLLEMAGEKSPSVAMYAIGALGRNGNADAVRKLTDLASEYRERNPLLIESVIDAIAEAASPEATPVLLELIGRGGSWGRKLLGKISLRKEEQDTETERLREQFMLPVTGALEKIADPNAIEAIADLAGHADPLVRCHVVGIFAKAGSPAQIPKLSELAEGDPNSLVREAARLAVDRLAPAQSSVSQ